ncbi:hypothetical protein BKA62DRAFT_702623 [Auriculariales sp. MPI-PUGE-AT-0066]|nr:hypothetical protein BKA62DRAFT_702623 [Auriculariales sp. MPI-PUGE-AT-0066]
MSNDHPQLFADNGEPILFRLLEQGIEPAEHRKTRQVIEMNGGKILSPGFTPRTGIVLGDPQSNEYNTLFQARPPTDTRLYAHYAWPITCVAAGCVLPVFELPLFLKRNGMPLKIHLHRKLQARRELERTVQLHAGMTDVDLEDADVVIVSNTNQGLQNIKARAKATASPVWINKCILQRTCDFESIGLERKPRAVSPDQSLASREPSMAPSDVREVKKRYRRQRCEFTAYDDLNLVKFIANHMFEFPKLSGNELYRYLVATGEEWTTRHTYQSWRERYVRRKDQFDVAIKRELDGADHGEDYEDVQARLAMRSTEPKARTKRRLPALSRRHVRHSHSDAEEEFDLSVTDDSEDQDEEVDRVRKRRRPNNSRPTVSRRKRVDGTASPSKKDAEEIPQRQSSSPVRLAIRKHPVKSSRKGKERALTPEEEEEEFTPAVPAAPPGDDMDDVMDWLTQVNNTRYDDEEARDDQAQQELDFDDSGDIAAPVPDEKLPLAQVTVADPYFAAISSSPPVATSTPRPKTPHSLSPADSLLRRAARASGPSPEGLPAPARVAPRTPKTPATGPSQVNPTRSVSQDAHSMAPPPASPVRHKPSRVDSLAEVEAELARDQADGGQVNEETDDDSISGARRRRRNYSLSSDDEDALLLLLHRQALAAPTRRHLPKTDESLVPGPSQVSAPVVAEQSTGPELETRSFGSKTRSTLDRTAVAAILATPLLRMDSSGSQKSSDSNVFKPSPNTRAAATVKAMKNRFTPAAGTRAEVVVHSLSGGRTTRAARKRKF